MPPIKLSKVVFVPQQGQDGDQVTLDLGDDVTVQLPAKGGSCALDEQTFGAFLDAVAARQIDVDLALARALKLYTARLQNLATAVQDDVD